MKPKLRIMFVDDEPLVLQGLQRTLRSQREAWEMEFRDSGAGALARMAEIPFDVIVSDMRMPGMNGADLLNRVTELYPRTVRLILSGHADQELIMKCVGNTHQFLTKPCEPEALKSVIARITAPDFHLENEQLRSVIAKMDHLPSFPALYAELVKTLQDPDVPMDIVGSIVARDVAMTASVLKLVNSAFFGLRRQISSPEEAASYLGVEVLKTLVLGLHAFTECQPARIDGLSVEGLWRHCLQISNGAKAIAQSQDADSQIVNEAFTAGMLHDVGRLVLATNFPTDYQHAHEFALSQGIPYWQAESAVFGSSHAEVGGYLLGLWGLPAPVVEAVTFHHTPSRSKNRNFSALAAVHVAETIVEDIPAPSEGPIPPAFDVVYLAELGIRDRLAAWHQLMNQGLAKAA